MNKTKRNSGFSIMETVIALAIIVIVTVAALSVVMASISARVKQANYSEAQDFAHNILECFKAADDTAKFEDYVKFAEGVELSQYAENDGYNYDAENKFSAKIMYYNNFNEIFISIEDTKGDEIISFSYVKGAK